MFDQLKDIFRPLKLYLLGKGILTVGVFAAAGIASAMGFSVLWPALLVGIGGTALTAMNRLYQERIYQDDMVNLYRDDIANQLGIAPEKVGRDELKEAAQENDVIAQALKRNRQQTWLSIGTAALAGLVSIGLIYGFGLDAHHLQDVAQHTLWTALRPLASFVGIGTVSGLTGLVLHQGLGTAIGYGTGISKAAAHDLIARMDASVKRGEPVAREQVYAIIVATNPSLDREIAKDYGKAYASMSHAQREQVMHDAHLAGTLDQIAIAITRKEVHAGYLAYAATDARLTRRPDASPAEAPPKAASNFVAKLGLAPRAAQADHAARLEQQRSSAAAMPGYSASL